MQRIPPRNQSNHRGVALILTLSVLAMILVLIVAYATLSRTEGQSAANYRDYVASRYLAQGSFNRGIAEIAYRYSGNVGNVNTGIESIYSRVDTNKLVNALPANTTFSDTATDIDHLTNNGGVDFAIRGSDNIIDYQILPGQTPGVYDAVPQWIGLKDTNGVLIGRVSYLISSGGLNINCIGNKVGTASSHARNMGYSVGELNLTAALMATDSNRWSTYALAKTDALNLIEWRYGGGGLSYPGGNGQPTDISLQSDGLDNNGDGLVDDLSNGDQGNAAGGVPQFYLRMTDGTINRTIQLQGDDRQITDLKNLHNGAGGLTDPAGNFLAAFAQVQKWFTTQSSVPVSSTLSNINDSINYPLTTIADQARYFSVFTNRLATVLPYSTNSAVERAQIAANIVSFASPASPSAGALTPFTATVGTTNVTGVGVAPFINQVVFHIIADVTADVVSGPPSYTNINVTLRCVPEVELWYPYTNDYAAATHVLTLTAGGTVPAPYSWGGNPPAANLVVPAYGTTTFDANVTNRFYRSGASIASIALGTSGIKQFGTPGSEPQAIEVTNLNFSTSMTRGGSIIDRSALFTTNLGLTISTNQYLATVFKATLAANGSLTNDVSFALNDPRVKTWLVEYMGCATNAATVNASSLGIMNYITNSTSPSIPASTNLCRPDLGEDSPYQLTTGGGLPKGIAPKTFYTRGTRLWNSVADLGRVHRGQAWRTLEMKYPGVDGPLLDVFTVVSNSVAGVPTTTYSHGRVNINARSDALPIWAALFTGMPLQTQAARDAVQTPRVDTDALGVVDPYFTQTRALGQMVGSRAGSFSSLASLTSISDFSNVGSNYPSVFTTGAPDYAIMQTDEDKEWIIAHIANLVGTQSQGNTFTIYSWGQTLRGPTRFSTGTTLDLLWMNTNRFVSAETLLIGMVRPEIKIVGAATNLDIKTIYYRYNPDMEFQ